MDIIGGDQTTILTTAHGNTDMDGMAGDLITATTAGVTHTTDTMATVDTGMVTTMATGTDTGMVTMQDQDTITIIVMILMEIHTIMDLATQ